MSGLEGVVRIVRRADNATNGYLSGVQYNEWRDECSPSPPTRQTLLKWADDSWVGILLAAGVEVSNNALVQSEYAPDWNEEEILEVLGPWIEENGPRSSEEYTGNGIDRPSMETVIDTFGGWPEAVRELGYNLSSPASGCTEEDIDKAIEYVYERVEGVPSVRQYRKLSRYDDPSMYCIKKFYGGFSIALYKNGYEPASYNSSFPKNVFREMVEEVEEELGHPPQAHEYEEMSDKAAVNTVKSKFGAETWNEALERMGYDVGSLHQEYTPEDYIDVGEKLVAEHDKVNSTVFNNYILDETDLSKNGWRNFWDSWKELAQEIGASYRKGSYSDEELEELIHNTADEVGRAPRQTEVVEHSEVSVSPLKRFDWYEKLEELGYDPLEAKSTYTRQQCIDAVARVAEELEKRPTQAEYRDNRRDGEPSPTVMTNWFEGFSDVLSKVGYQPRKISNPDYEMCKESVRKAIEDIGNTPTISEYEEWRKQQSESHPSHPTISRISGYNAIIHELGHDVNHKVSGYSEEEYRSSLEEIVQRYDGNGVPPAKVAYKMTGMKPSPISIIREYDGWNNALEEFGYDINHDPHTVNGDYADGGHYYGPDWITVREEIREKDNHTCTCCGMPNEDHKERYGQDLHVHHIIPFKEFKPVSDYSIPNTSENLATVCMLCHRKLETSAHNGEYQEQTQKLDGERFARLPDSPSELSREVMAKQVLAD